MSNIKMDIRPIVVRDKDREKAGVVASLFGLALCAASYPLLFDSRPFLFYFGIFGCIFAFVCFCISCLIHPHNNKVVFKMDECGIYFHDKRSHSFGWPELKQISVRFVTNENGKKTRLLYFTTQDNTDYRFNIFYYVLSYVWTIQRLKKSVHVYSKGRVPFIYYTIWNKSSS